jgi:glycosyltransferase involved in cell wall biosynthesis
MRDFAVDVYQLDQARCEVVYPFSSLPNAGSGEVLIPEVLAGCEKTLVYSGALGEKQAPEKLLRLMDEFAQKQPDFEVLVFSDGPIFEDLKRRYSQRGSHVKFHGLVPDAEIEGLLKASTIQIIPQRLGLSHGAFPSKLPNLLAAGTAIFAIADAESEVTQIVNQYSRGKAIATWSDNECLAALGTFAVKIQSLPNTGPRNQADVALQDRFDIGRFAQRIYRLAAQDSTDAINSL